MTQLSTSLADPAYPASNDPAKIAFVCNSAWGIYNFRLGIIKALQSRGIKILVIAPHDDFAEKLKSENCEFIHLAFDSKGANFLTDFVTYLKLRNIYRSARPAFIFHYTIKPNIYGTYAAKSVGIPSIALVTGLGYAFGLKSLLSLIVKRLYKTSLTHSEKTWFLNQEDYSYFLYERIVAPAGAEIVHSEGIDTDLFRPRRAGNKNRNFTVLLVARMLWNKGIKEFVEAAKILKKRVGNIDFQMLGFLGVDNPESIGREQMTEWVNEGLVEYLGVSDNVATYIAQADCVVLPSYYREGVPRVLMEAASMEKPIVTTDNVGCRDVVEDGKNGYLCRIQDAEDLAAKIEMVFNLSETERVLMGKNGRRKMISEFDEKRIINKYLDTLRQYVPLPDHPLTTTDTPRTIVNL